MRASTLSVGIVPAVVLFLSSLSFTSAQHGVHRLGVADLGDDFGESRLQGLDPRAADYGEPSDYGYYPPPYGEETSALSTASDTGLYPFPTEFSETTAPTVVTKTETSFVTSTAQSTHPIDTKTFSDEVSSDATGSATTTSSARSTHSLTQIEETSLTESSGHITRTVTESFPSGAHSTTETLLTESSKGDSSFSSLVSGSTSRPTSELITKTHTPSSAESGNPTASPTEGESGTALPTTGSSGVPSSTTASHPGTSASPTLPSWNSSSSVEFSSSQLAENGTVVTSTVRLTVTDSVSITSTSPLSGSASSTLLSHSNMPSSSTWEETVSSGTWSPTANPAVTSVVTTTVSGTSSESGNTGGINGTTVTSTVVGTLSKPGSLTTLPESSPLTSTEKPSGGSSVLTSSYHFTNSSVVTVTITGSGGSVTEIPSTIIITGATLSVTMTLSGTVSPTMPISSDSSALPVTGNRTSYTLSGSGSHQTTIWPTSSAWSSSSVAGLNTTVSVGSSTSLVNSTHKSTSAVATNSSVEIVTLTSILWTSPGHSTAIPSGEIHSSSTHTGTSSSVSWANRTVTTVTATETVVETSGQATVSTKLLTLTFTSTFSPDSTAWVSSASGNATSITSTALLTTTESQFPGNTTSRGSTGAGSSATTSPFSSPPVSTVISNATVTSVIVTVTTQVSSWGSAPISTGVSSHNSSSSTGTTVGGPGSTPPFANSTSMLSSGQTVTTTVWGSAPSVSWSTISSHSHSLPFNFTLTTGLTSRPSVTPFNTTWLSSTVESAGGSPSQTPPFPTTNNSTRTLSTAISPSNSQGTSAIISSVTVTVTQATTSNSTTWVTSKTGASTGSLSWSFSHGLNSTTLWPTGGPTSAPTGVSSYFTHSSNSSATGSPIGTISSMPWSNLTTVPPFSNSTAHWTVSPMPTSASGVNTSFVTSSSMPSGVGSATGSSSVFTLVNSTIVSNGTAIRTTVLTSWLTTGVSGSWSGSSSPPFPTGNYTFSTVVSGVTSVVFTTGSALPWSTTSAAASGAIMPSSSTLNSGPLWTNTTMASSAESTPAVSTTTTTQLVTVIVSTVTATSPVVVVSNSTTVLGSTASQALPWSTTRSLVMPSTNTTLAITMTEVTTATVSTSWPVHNGTVVHSSSFNGNVSSTRHYSNTTTPPCTHSFSYSYPNITTSATVCTRFANGTTTFTRCSVVPSTTIHPVSSAPTFTIPVNASTSCNTTTTTAHRTSLSRVNGTIVSSSTSSNFYPLPTTFETSTTVREPKSGSQGFVYPVPTVSKSGDGGLPNNPNYPWGADSPLHRHQNVTTLGNGLLDGAHWLPSWGKTAVDKLKGLLQKYPTGEVVEDEK